MFYLSAIGLFKANAFFVSGDLEASDAKHCQTLLLHNSAISFPRESRSHLTRTETMSRKRACDVCYRRKVRRFP